MMRVIVSHVVGIDPLETRNLNILQREKLLSEISECTNYFNREMKMCKKIDFFRKRWLSKNIRELDKLHSLIEKGLTKGYYVSQYTGII